MKPELPWMTSVMLAAARAVDPGPRNLLHVLLYHRIEGHGGDPHVLSATRAAFEAQMSYVAGHYAAITAGQVVAALDGEAELPRRAVLVTFDDAYSDFLTHAWPVLRRWRVPALLFVPTAFPGSGRGFWWDELYELIAQTEAPDLAAFGLGPLPLRTTAERWVAVRRINAYLKPQPSDIVDQRLQELRQMAGGPVVKTPRPLTWTDLRALVGEGLAIGSHTRTHPALRSLSATHLAAEVSGAHDDIRREIGITPRLFSYPFGASDSRLVPLLEELGYAGAFVSLLGRNRVGDVDPFRIYRHSVDTTQSLMRVGLSMVTLYAGARESGRAAKARLRHRPAQTPARLPADASHGTSG